MSIACPQPAGSAVAMFEIGSITPGRRADILLCSDLDTLKIDQVIAQGQLAAEDGQVVLDPPEHLIDFGE